MAFARWNVRKTAEIKTRPNGRPAKACKITSEAFSYIVGVIKEGMPREIAGNGKLHGYPRRQTTSINTIVAPRKRIAAPCHPGERKVRKGDMIYHGLWRKVDGYCAIWTRTVAWGARRKNAHVYDVVFEPSAWPRKPGGGQSLRRSTPWPDYIASEASGTISPWAGMR